MQLASNLIDKVFSEIDVNDKGAEIEILYSFMTDLFGEKAEGWKTGIAIDASVSMMVSFGRGLKGTVPEDVKKKYIEKGWIQIHKHDGRTVYYYEKEAQDDAIKKG